MKNEEYKKIVKDYDDKVKALSTKDKDYLKKRNSLIMEVRDKIINLQLNKDLWQKK